MAAREPTSSARPVAGIRSTEWLFYLWVPVGIGLFMGATQPGRSAAWPIGYSLGFWVVVNCVDWWLADLGCRAANRVLRPWRPGLATVLLVGSIAASILLVAPANREIIAAWYRLLPPEVPRVPLTRWPDVMPAELLAALVPGLMPWLAANYVFYRFAGLPRYGFEPPGAQAQETLAAAPPPPVFLAKVRPERRGELLALNAQGHYLRVITSRGEDLVLHTFGDAVEELGERRGLRVHRSWWVSRRALDDGELATSKRLRLPNGLEIPVSRTFRAQLQRELDEHPRNGG